MPHYSELSVDVSQVSDSGYDTVFCPRPIPTGRPENNDFQRTVNPAKRL
jgi:hypothetical protein